MKKWLKLYGRDLLYVVMLLVLSIIIYNQQKQIDKWIDEVSRLQKVTINVNKHLKDVEAGVDDADYRFDETESRIEEHQSDIENVQNDIDDAQDDIDMNRIETEQNEDDINDIKMRLDE